MPENLRPALLVVLFLLFNGCGGITEKEQEPALSAPIVEYAESFLFSMGSAASVTPTLTGGAATLFSISPVTLPAGLTFFAADGKITGTPTEQFSSTDFTVTATNSVGSDSETFSLGVKGPFWITDGYSGNGVKAMHLMNNVLYVGGYFTMVGPYRGFGGIVDLASGGIPSGISYPFIDDFVSSVVGDDVNAGAFYVGGSFLNIGGASRRYLARINADGSLDADWNPNPDGAITALHVDTANDILYVAGAFTTIAGAAHAGLAAFNLNTKAVIPGFTPAAVVGGSIKAMAAAGGILYVGGSFTPNRLQSFNTADGTAAAWTPAVSGNSPVEVNALLVDGANIYFGGHFTGVDYGGGNQARKSLAAATTAGAMVAWAPTATVGAVNEAFVYVLRKIGALYYPGGNFDQINGQNRQGIAAINAAAVEDAWNPLLNGTVYDFFTSAGQIYVAGIFSMVNGADSQSNFAQIDLIDPLTVGAINPGFSNSVRALAFSTDKFFAGGDFSSFVMAPRNHAAAMDATTGQLLFWNPNVNYYVYALAGKGDAVYLGGAFDDVGGTTRIGLASVNASSAGLNSWNPGITPGGQVSSIAMSTSTLFIGGAFALAGGQARNDLAEISLSTGNATTTFNPGTNGSVNAVALDGTTLYAGGSFTTVGADTQNYRNAAALDISTGNAGTWNPDPDGIVRAVLVNGNQVFIGGAFANVKTLPRAAVASLTKTGASALNAFDAAIVGITATVYSLAASPTLLFFGGINISTVGTLPRNNLAAVALSDAAVDTSFIADANGFVHSLLVDGSTVYVGGTFTTLSGRKTTGFGAVDLGGTPL